jgi:hypothetical protein
MNIDISWKEDGNDDLVYRKANRKLWYHNENQ